MSLRPNRLWRPRGLVVLLLTVGPACSEGGGGSAADARPPAVATTASSAPTSTGATTAPPTTAQSPTSASTTSPPTTASVPTSSPPSAQPTASPASDDEWIPIVQEVLDRRTALYTNPDPALVETVAVPGSEPYESLMLEIENLVAKGWRLEGAVPGRVTAVRVEHVNDPTTPTGAVLTVTTSDDVSGGRIVDSTGAVVQEVQIHDAGDRRSINISRRGPDDPWRLNFELYLSPEGAG